MNDHNPQTEKEFIDMLTKYDDALKAIKKLEKLELSDISDKELEVLLDDLFPIIPITSTYIPKDELVFRARINKGNRPFTEVKEIYVRDSDLINNYGRAHKPNEQIFYCASNYLLAANEVMQDLRNCNGAQDLVVNLTVGVWKVQKELHVTNIIHSKILHSLRQDILEQYHNHQKIFLKRAFRDETINSHNLILEFFSDQFTKENIKNNHEYKFSAFYASRLKQINELIQPPYQAEKFDGVNYPSVAMKFKGDNQAIFTNDFDSKLKLINAIQVTCDNINFETGDCNTRIINQDEFIKDGIITWQIKS